MTPEDTLLNESLLYPNIELVKRFFKAKKDAYVTPDEDAEPITRDDIKENSNDCHNPEDGRFCETGGSEKVTTDDLSKAIKRADSYNADPRRITDEQMNLDAIASFVYNEDNPHRNELLDIASKKYSEILSIMKDKGVFYDEDEAKYRILTGATLSMKDDIFPFPVYVSSGKDDKASVGLLVSKDGKFEMFEGNDEATPGTQKLVNELMGVGDKEVKVWASHTSDVVQRIQNGDIPEGIYVSPNREHAAGYWGKDRELISFKIPLNRLSQESEVDWKVLPKEDPKIEISRVWQDNPGVSWMGERGKEWLDADRAYAAKKYDPKRGRVIAGTATAGFEGRLPTSMVSSLPGENGEHKNKEILTDYKASPIKESIKNEGVKEPITIFVNHLGDAYISEGNHRAALAKEFKHKDVPVEVRYFAGGELVDGPWKLDKFRKEEKIKENSNSCRVPAGSPEGGQFSNCENGIEAESITPGMSKKKFDSYIKAKREETFSRPEVKEAVANTEGAKITKEGLELNVVRYQEPEMAGGMAVRGAVFYLPESNSPYGRHYRSTKNVYGGSEKFEGKTIYRNPLIIKGATGGAVPERAYAMLEGKAKLKEVQDAISKKCFDRVFGKSDPNTTIKNIGDVLKEFGGDPGYAYDIYDATKEGNTRRYAIQEHVIAARIKKEGYDGLIGYGKYKGKMRFSEVLDVRTNENPFQDNWEDNYEQYYDDFYEDRVKKN
jgi:hypothetical protein